MIDDCVEVIPRLTGVGVKLELNAGALELATQPWLGGQRRFDLSAGHDLVAVQSQPSRRVA